MPRPVTPEISVDLIVEVDSKIVLVERKYEPLGWALPGGFVEVGETVEQAAIRECKEETDLDIELIRQFHVYSDPKRDPRGHTVTLVYLAKASGTPKGGDDAAVAKLFSKDDLPKPIVFDHAQILGDFLTKKY